MKKIVLLVAFLLVGYVGQSQVYRIATVGESKQFVITDTVSGVRERPYLNREVLADTTSNGTINIYRQLAVDYLKPIGFPTPKGHPYTAFLDGNNSDATFESSAAVLDWFADNTGFNLAGSGSASTTENVTETPITEYGVAGDGTTDDSSKFATAFATGKNIALEPGKTYAISTLTTLTLANDGQVLNGNGATLLFPNKWDNKSALEITGDNVTVKNLNIIEASASAIDSDKNEANNIGLSVKGLNAIIDNIKVEGFAFPLAARNSVADGLSVNNCDFSKGFAWVEFDSARNVTVKNSSAHNNGLDGWKLQNEFSRTMDGFIMDNCKGYSNGQRDTAAGGAENSNGNGLDMYNGGNETFISNSRFYANYGSGVNIKGDPINSQKQSNIYFSNVQAENNIAVSAGTVHGFEINTNSSTAGSLVHFTNCLANNNPGIGFYLLGGYGIHLNNSDAVSNASGGVWITKYAKDISVNQCNIFANGGGTAGALKIGNSDNSAFDPIRVRVINSIFSGNYDFNTGEEFDPKDAATTKVSETAIRIYSDVSNVIIEGNSFYNFFGTDGTVWTRGGNVEFNKNYMYGAIRAGLGVYGGSINIAGNHFDETDFSSATDAGSIVVSSGVAYIGRNKFTQASNVGGSFAIQSFTATGKLHYDQDVTNITKFYGDYPSFRQYNENGYVVNSIALASSRNIAASDVWNTLHCTSTATLTITSGFSAMEVGDIINLSARGVILTITGASGVLINGSDAGSVAVDGVSPWSGGLIEKIDTNSYMVL